MTPAQTDHVRRVLMRIDAQRARLRDTAREAETSGLTCECHGCGHTFDASQLIDDGSGNESCPRCKTSGWEFA